MSYVIMFRLIYDDLQIFSGDKPNRFGIEFQTYKEASDFIDGHSWLKHSRHAICEVNIPR